MLKSRADLFMVSQRSEIGQEYNLPGRGSHLKSRSKMRHVREESQTACRPSVSFLSGSFRVFHRSADWQSAVSPVVNRQMIPSQNPRDSP
jgi:hypothetical protein